MLFGASGPARAEPFASLGEWVEDRLAEERVASLAVAVARGEELLWAEAWGFADRELGVPATPSTPYFVASVTKPFTMTAVMVAIERRLLDLDAPVSAFLGPETAEALRWNEHEPSIRELASHTAGLGVHHRFYAVELGERPPPVEVAVHRHGRALRAPGERTVYSNLGYGVLERAVEHAFGVPFAEALEAAVLAPLALESASLPTDPEHAAGVAARYDVSGERLRFYDSEHRGASALAISVLDLVRFGQLHAGAAGVSSPRLLERSTFRAMQQPVSRAGDGAYYGLGWRLDRGPGGWPVVGHTGGMPGVSSSLALVPQLGVVVAVAANSRTELVSELSQRLLQALLPRSVRRLAPTPSASLPDVERRGSLRARAPRKLRGRWSGTVWNDSGQLPVAVEIGARALEVRLGERVAGIWPLRAGGRRLVASGPGPLEGCALALESTLEPEAAGQRLRLVLNRRKGHLEGALLVLSSAHGLPAALSHRVILSDVEP